MARTRLIPTVAAAGVIVAGITAATAWADGPGGVVENDTAISRAVGTGVFTGELVGFQATGATNDEASAAVVAQCQNAGGQQCTSDEVTNDNLCIASVADDTNDVVAGGAGPTVEAARADALQRAAANNTPLATTAAVVISVCA